jgi:hypothetical protein
LLKHRDFIYPARRTWAPFEPAISAIRYKGITEMGLPQKNMRCRLALVVCLIGSVFNLRPGQGGMRWIDEHFDTSGTAGWVGPDFLN